MSYPICLQESEMYVFLHAVAVITGQEEPRPTVCPSEPLIVERSTLLTAAGLLTQDPSLLLNQTEQTAKDYANAYREMYEASEGQTVTVHAHPHDHR